MASVSEILGGILRDLAQGNAAADEAARALHEAYRRDPLLSHFPVPRFAVRDATLRLRFAIDAVATPPEALAAWRDGLARAWQAEVVTVVLPGLADALGADRTKALVAAVKGATPAQFPVADAFDKGPELLLSATLDVLAPRAEPAPPRRGAAPRAASAEDARLRRLMTERLADAYARFAGPAREKAAAALALRADVAVAVTRGELAGVPEAQIQEISLTLRLDEVQPAIAPQAP